MEDTIAAISTPIGRGGIAIVRMSGSTALAIADRVFVSPRSPSSSFPTHTVHYGTIVDGGVVIDEVLLLVMREPRTYTTEDVVEISCHGGVVSARRVLAACLRNGARCAEPGEFTKRAFLNGRIDLTQAESVMDLISAHTDLAHLGAMNVLSGKLTERIKEISNKLLSILAHIEVYIDFPEEDVAADAWDKMKSDLEYTLEKIGKLITSSKEGKILRNGVTIAIIGRPNVGKSSLLNALLEEERAIVTPYPGTTRDTLEQMADIRGIPVQLIDTAGIRNPRGAIEYHGIGRSYKALSSSDIVIFILDGSRKLSSTDEEIASLTRNRKSIYLVSKADLPQKLKLPDSFSLLHITDISVKNRMGLEELKTRIEELVWTDKQPQAELCLSINERQEDSIRRAQLSLASAMRAITREEGLEIVAQELKISLNALGEVTGSTTTEDILDRVFSTFCIGK